MNIFNRVKPEPSVFRGGVVWCRLTDWGGSFDYKTAPLDKFMTETADHFFYLHHLEKRFKILCQVSVGFVSFAAYVGVLWLLLPRIPEGLLAWLFAWVAFGVPVSLDVWLSRLLNRIPRRIADDEQREGLVERIRSLQGQLAANRGEQVRPMTDEEIHDRILSFQSRWIVVPRHNS